MSASFRVAFALVLVAGWKLYECQGAASSSKGIDDTDTTTSACGYEWPVVSHVAC